MESYAKMQYTGDSRTAASTSLMAGVDARTSGIWSSGTAGAAGRGCRGRGDRACRPQMHQAHHPTRSTSDPEAALSCEFKSRILSDIAGSPCRLPHIIRHGSRTKSSPGGSTQVIREPRQESGVKSIASSSLPAITDIAKSPLIPSATSLAAARRRRRASTHVIDEVAEPRDDDARFCRVLSSSPTDTTYRRSLGVGVIEAPHRLMSKGHGVQNRSESLREPVDEELSMQARVYQYLMGINSDDVAVDDHTMGCCNRLEKLGEIRV